MKKNLLYILLAVVLVAGGIGIYQWNKPKRTAASEEPVAIFSAAELLTAFTSDAAAANASYLDKVVEVSGQIVAVDQSDSGSTTVTLETGDPLSAVTCSFAPGVIPKASVGTTLKVRGICSGIQGDMMPAVVLTQCSEISE